MDQKIVKIEELTALEHIANLSASVIVDVELFVRLAIVVERYIEEPNEQNLGFLKEIYQQLTKTFPSFNQNRLALFSVLQKKGNIIIEHPTKKDKKPTTLEPIKQDIPNNVVNIFKKVD